MKSYPLVSVIITIHNGERYLEETIQSILKQTYPNYEVIAIDHGSQDGSREVLERYSEVRVHSQEQKGNAHARNTGAKLARGDYIAFIDQDDLWYPDKLIKQMDVLVNDSSLLFTISHFRSYLSPGSALPKWSRQETFVESKPDYSPSSLVMRKEAFEKNGYFKENMRYASDIDWFFSAKDCQIPMAVVPELLHLRRVHDDNQSYDGRPLKKEMLAAIRGSVQRQKGVH